jgi:hypothetical protein
VQLLQSREALRQAPDFGFETFFCQSLILNPPSDSRMTQGSESRYQVKKTLVPTTHHHHITVTDSFSPATSNDGTVFPQYTEVVAGAQSRKIWIDDMRPPPSAEIDHCASSHIPMFQDFTHHPSLPKEADDVISLQLRTEYICSW